MLSAVQRLDRWLLAAAPPERLAALRIVLGGSVLVYIFATVGEFARVASLPADSFDPVGVATLLSGPASERQLWVLFAFLCGSGLAFVSGTWFRVSGPAFALTTLAWASYHSSWGQMLHFEHLFTLHLLILGFSPSADAWGLSKSPAQTQHVRYGWPIRLMAIATVLAYIVSALTKLRVSGLEWVNTTTLANHIAYSATRLELLGAPAPPLASIVVGKPWLIASMAWAALLTELAAPLALLGGRWRRYWVLAALLMHVGIAATMLVWFGYQALGLAFLPFYRAERLLLGISSVWKGVAGRRTLKPKS